MVRLLLLGAGFMFAGGAVLAGSAVIVTMEGDPSVLGQGAMVAGYVPIVLGQGAMAAGCVSGGVGLLWLDRRNARRRRRLDLEK